MAVLNGASQAPSSPGSEPRSSSHSSEEWPPGPSSSTLARRFKLGSTLLQPTILARSPLSLASVLSCGQSLHDSTKHGATTSDNKLERCLIRTHEPARAHSDRL